MALSRKQIVTVIFLLAIVFALPVAVFLTRKRQDVRPRALQGKANFLLSTDTINTTVGKNVDVLVSLQTTDSALKVSGVDFLLLYDKNRLDVGNIVPNVTVVTATAPFTEAPIVSSGGSFDENYNFIRVAEIARKKDADLPKGTFQLAKITFRGRAVGQAKIKFPDDDKFLEISGTGTSNAPTATPTVAGPTITSVGPSPTPGGPTLTPTPTSVVPTPTPTTKPTPTPLPGLMADWKMDETSGSTVADSAGSNSGTATGTTIVDGKFGKARNFNGAGDYISIPNQAPFNFSTGSSFSFTAWVKTSGNSDFKTIVGKANSAPSAPYTGWGFRINNINQLEFYMVSNYSPPSTSGLLYIYTNSSVITNNSPHHVAATYDGTGVTAGVKLYVDGVLQTNLTRLPDTLAGRSILNYGTLLIGRQNPPSTYRPNYADFLGDLDEVQVYSRVLSASEVAGLASIQ